MELNYRKLFLIILFPSIALAQFPSIERQGGTGSGVTDHGALTGLSDDDHPQYCAINGRSGGQTIIGGTATGEDLTLKTNTSNDGSIFFGNSGVLAIDETTGTLNLGAATPTQANRLYATSTGVLTSGQENTMRVVMLADPSSSSAASIRALDVYANLADSYTTAVTGAVMGSRYLAGNTRQTGELTTMVGLQLQAINGIVFGAPSGTATTQNITAAIFQAVNNSATTTATATVTGGQFTGENRGTNTIAAVTAGQFTVTNNNASATSTALRGNWLRTSTVFGSSVTAGTVTTGYMLDSEGWPSGPTYTNRPYQIRLQSGATTAYGIAQQGTAHFNYFQGKTTFGETSDATAQVEINGNADDEQLRVIGHSTQTSNIVLVEDSAGTDLFNISNTGTATFAGDVTVPTEAYDATNWNGSNEVPTKDAVRDKIETLSAGSGITGLIGDSGGTTTGSTVTIAGGTGLTSVRSSDTITLNLDALSTAENCIGADVQMTSTGTFYDGGSVSLAAGTWLITGTATITRTTTTKTHYTCKLWDGTTVESSSEASYDSSNPHSVSISLNGIVSPGSTTSYKISCTSTSGSTNLNLKAATPDSGSGNHATCTRAIRVG